MRVECPHSHSTGVLLPHFTLPVASEITGYKETMYDYEITTHSNLVHTGCRLSAGSLVRHGPGHGNKRQQRAIRFAGPAVTRTAIDDADGKC